MRTAKGSAPGKYDALRRQTNITILAITCLNLFFSGVLNQDNPIARRWRRRLAAPFFEKRCGKD